MDFLLNELLNVIYYCKINLIARFIIFFVTFTGQSLLGMACMLHFAADKFDDNVRMVKFLVENGALIEHRDKAGYAPLDYAARNNNTALIRLLLDNGADVGRNNKLLVAPREDILTHVTDPDCYRLLMIKVKAHKMREKREQDRIDEIRRDEEEKEKIRKEIERFDARRAKNRQEKHRLAGEAYHKGKAEEVAEKMRLDLKTMMGKDSGDSLYKYGHWERGQSGHWDWKKTQLAVKHEDVYAEGLSTITKIRDKYKFETFNNRWKSITDGHELEVKWTKSDAFEEIEQASLTKSKKIDKFRLEEKNEPLSTNDIDYRDENDDLLQDVDMSDLMDALCK